MLHRNKEYAPWDLPWVSRAVEGSFLFFAAEAGDAEAAKDSSASAAEPETYYGEDDEDDDYDYGSVRLARFSCGVT